MAEDDSKVADGGSLTFPGFDGVAQPYPRSSGPRMGSQASSFSPQDPPPVQLLWEKVDWCMQRLLRVLGFDLKRAEIQALWLPIYRGFGLISKRIQSRSYFNPSIGLIYVFVGINPKGKNSRRGTSLE
jgi:hypothetical protein